MRSTTRCPAPCSTNAINILANDSDLTTTATHGDLIAMKRSNTLKVWM